METEHSDGRTKLAEFIRQTTTQAKFAREIQCSQPHLSLILKGERGVSLKLAKRISDATRGTVTVESLPDSPIREPQC